ncbi:MAG: J domain-containing protein, partial [Flavobacteriales bacterium]
VYNYSTCSIAFTFAMISDRLFQAYRRLELSPKASIDEVKLAYRSLAKKVHPDVNSAEDANEQFIAINEAMDYIIAVRTGKIYDKQKGAYHKPSQQQEQQKRAKQKQREEYYAQWVKEQARKRAEEAQNWKEYVKSDHYHSVQRLDSGQFTLILGMYAFLAFVLLASTSNTRDPDWSGVIIPYLFCGVFLIPLTYFLVQNINSEIIWFKHCLRSWRKNKGFKFSVLDIVNYLIVLFFFFEVFLAFLFTLRYISLIPGNS